MSTKRARRASSPHPVTPFIAEIPTTPMPMMNPQDMSVPERKATRPKSIQATPDVRSRRSSLKAAAVPSQPAQNAPDRFRSAEFANDFASGLPPNIPHTPPLPSYLGTPTTSGINRERSNSYSVAPTGHKKDRELGTDSPKRYHDGQPPRAAKPPPSPRQAVSSRPRSKSSSRRDIVNAQEVETEPPMPPKFDYRLPTAFQEQNSFSEDSPSPRPSKSGTSSRAPLKASRRAAPETDVSTSREARRYSQRVPVPRREEIDPPRTPSLPQEPVTSPPRDLQKLAHFRVMNADSQGESSDEVPQAKAAQLSPIARQTPPVEFQRRYTSQLQTGRSPNSEISHSLPLAARSPSAQTAMVDRLEDVAEPQTMRKAESQRTEDRRERRKSQSTSEMRKARSVSDARPPPRLSDSPSKPRTPQLSSRVFNSGTPGSESLTPRSSRPQPQTFPLTSPAPTTTPLDTTPRRGTRAHAIEPPSESKSNRSRKNTETKQVEASPRERSHALRGLFDKLGLGFAFDQTPQDPAPNNRFESSISVPSPNFSSKSEGDDVGDEGDVTITKAPLDEQHDRQAALFTALSSTPSRNQPEPAAHDFDQLSHGDFDENDDASFVQSHAVDDDDDAGFGLTAATSLNRISASPNPEALSDTSTFQGPGSYSNEGNTDDLYFSPPLHRTTPKRPTLAEKVVQEYTEKDRQSSKDSRDGNPRSSSRPPPSPAKEGQYDVPWSNGYGKKLPAPVIPAASPSIVIQPSTSMSSNEAIPRAPSMDSVSQYSDNESLVEDRPGATHPAWHQNGNPDRSQPVFTVGDAYDRSRDGASDRGTADKRSSDSQQLDARSREPSHSSRSSFDDASSSSTQPTIDKRLASASKTWKSTLPADALRSLLEKYGAIEMRRQEVIWELCNTEQDFVEGLRTISRLFVQPLRTKDGKWIPGLPSDITSLFDWLDDIIRLHSHISTALLDVRSSQYPIVLQVAESLRAFVPCLEFHQPYLVRLEAASQLIAEMAQDRDSDLGEFIRIQTASPECGGMPLGSFLLKPIQRLMKYPLFFKRLLELTPRNHPDYIATFSLMHSTDMVIKGMQEVKTREDEYDLVKNLSERIKGLPEGFSLASRDRRLIAQGLLRRAFPNEKERVQLESSPVTVPGLAAPEPSKPSPSTPSQGRTPFNVNMHKLLPITSPRFQHQFDLDVHTNGQYSRPDSLASDFSTEPSFGDGISDSTRSTTSSSGMMSPSTTLQSMRPDSIASSCASFDQGYMSRDPYAAYAESQTLRRRSSLRSIKGKREVPIYAFVFSDLVLLTTPGTERNILRSPRSGENKEYWRIIDDVGISRVLGVKNLSGKLDHDHLLSIDLLPMAPGQDLDLSSSPYAVPVYLSLPERMTSRMALAPTTILEEARAKWLDAFEKCSKHTLRSLCFPPKIDADDPGSLLLDPLPKSRESVFAMLASGAPLLRSPSQLSMNVPRHVEGDEAPERLERQWWSAQFQKVMREMERGEIPWMTSGVNSTMAVQPQHRRTADPKRASVMGGPRPLLLGSKLASGSAGEERKSGLLRSLSRKGR